MKKLVVKNELCIGCHECEETCAVTFFKENNADKSSIRVLQDYEGKKNINVCNQCGVCIDICPVEAIYQDKLGVVRIKKEICVGCFMCVGFCPEEAMRQHDDYIEPFKCVACGLCSKKCPTEAIFIEKSSHEEFVVESVEETATAHDNNAGRQ